MPRIALTGGAYQARSVIASAQRCLNLYAEPMPQAQGEPSAYAYYPTPGLRLLGTLPKGPVRGIRQCTTGGIYAVGGDTVYLVDPVAWTSTVIGSMTTMRPYPVSMADNGASLVIVDGTTSGWTVDLATHTFASITATASQTPVTASTTEAIVKDTARYTAFTPANTMSLTSATVTLGTGYTGNMLVAVFSDSGGSPDLQVGGLVTLTNPVAGVNTATYDVNSYPALTGGSQYWIGFDSDTSAGTWSVASGTSGLSSSTTYAKFPASTPDTTSAAAVVVSLKMASDPGGMWAGADRVDYLDTYYLFNKPKTPQFYSSLSLSTSFDSLAQDFANKESYSDLLVSLAVAKREIWLLGERTTEIWYNSGASDFQFEQIQGVFVDQGCAAKYSVAVNDNGVYWLGYNRAGHGIVLYGAGYLNRRISTYAIENELTTYSRIDDAIGFVYSLAGHNFYVLTFPTADRTWVYDIVTQQWHEWLWIDNNGIEHRHRANCMYAVNGMVVAGDWNNGNLYAVELSALTDNGQPIKRQRSYPHIINELNRVYYRKFHVDLESGNPYPASGGNVGTFLSTTFTAADGTLLSAYSDPADINAHWTLVSGSDAAITGDELTGPAGGGASLYQSPPAPSSLYMVQFQAVPTNYAAVGHAAIFLLARSTGVGSGYRATVSGDGTQYYVTLGVEGGGSTTMALGTIASGAFIITMTLRGALITLTVQRTTDYAYLQPSGVWLGTNVPAITLDDGTYTAAGSVFIGGNW